MRSNDISEILERRRQRVIAFIPDEIKKYWSSLSKIHGYGELLVEGTNDLIICARYSPSNIPLAKVYRRDHRVERVEYAFDGKIYNENLMLKMVKLKAFA